MLTAIKIVMRLFAVLICGLTTWALHALMPDRYWLLSWLDFAALGMANLFAIVLVVSSFLIGRAPGRSKLGQRLHDKVEAQTGKARQVYEQKRCRTRSEASSPAQTTVRQPPPER